ncbi:hypothetical protein Asulf_01065 [Archaeoglobus sulfaticallidus PM70-1]|uniref:N-acetyltransferase domain-containing protein n=1 Tax=Archaeoglobus sulfaticallidus PM70-1 TaxID=387631 RepID=N0BKN1_9EURY|nr:GNAT family N-acetyltransferase [Archaeoglobus sulfaticallidus]AGK61066.1 hypothetical protein Asulf_01065 [Archaeoglobus sulfaticallidus PM70-1]
MIEYSEFFTDEDGDIIFITSYHEIEREKLIQMYETFSREKRCCGLPPIKREMIESWIDFLHNNGHMFIAKHGDRVIGHIAVVPKDDSAEFVIFMHQDYEGKLIGGKMVKTVEKFLKSLGIRKLKAVTERTNRNAIKLYQKLGFKKESAEGGYIYFIKILG